MLPGHACPALPRESEDSTLTVALSDAGRGSAPRQSLLDQVADWSIRPSSLLFRLSWVAGTFVAATALRLALSPYLPPGFPFLTYFPAIAVTAVVAGSSSGAVLAVLCFLSAWFLFVPPFYTFPVDPPSLVAMGLYVAVVSTDVGLVYIMRRSLRRLAEAEAASREVARSRTLMFHELQHRGSNNRAVVASLLQLQKRGVKDPDAAHALEAAVARVNVVSRLNRLLHNPEAQDINFGAFLRAMVPDAMTASGIAGRVTAEVRVEPVVVTAETAVPLGLVATELLANAIEHGFPDGRAGTILVTLERVGDVGRLAIRDDGVGLPPDFDVERTRSLGLMIARQFASQLDAPLTIERDAGGGAVARLDVPLGG